ncbi:MAG TPA: hypothetical protein VGM06_24185 [Polyangiaceae bacterium]|jgi:hypothetical protein|nr:hypothetical protein [Polyangiaceae bacterium]
MRVALVVAPLVLMACSKPQPKALATIDGDVRSRRPSWLAQT